MSFAQKVIRFNQSLELDIPLPEGVRVMNPFSERQVIEISDKFYLKYFSNNSERTLLLGINPGRFGAGVTGIPFTDPVKLEKNCGIANSLKKITEPSAGFVYDMIDACGGPEKFYRKYFIHAVCPLGFTKDGVNYNFYDSKELEKAVTPFIISSIEKILTLPVRSEICFCLGMGKNFLYLKRLNDKYHFFEKIIPLPHPRWIVQYRRKSYKEFIAFYQKELHKGESIEN
jgi:hypothetical protein